MLSLFRTLAVGPARIRPAAPLVARLASYSTQPDKAADNAALHDVLQEEGDHNDPEYFKGNAEKPSGASWLTKTPYRPFREGNRAHFIQPKHFSIESRTKSSPPRRKSDTLGPGRREARRSDLFYQLGIDPLHEFQNVSLMSGFVTDMGKIKSRAVTRLTNRSQRRLAKAIRRARMAGIMPIMSRRPFRDNHTR
ncbi:hypothetical protein PLICRDRAFT_48214 [Plicaturopsis crispa FD-325 SS-3]|nr:hypothetical protein PLICRDRAFT_48214 [Plicaturopsis crispa FD-325 SS-3]